MRRGWWKILLLGYGEHIICDELDIANGLLNVDFRHQFVCECINLLCPIAERRAYDGEMSLLTCNQHIASFTVVLAIIRTKLSQFQVENSLLSVQIHFLLDLLLSVVVGLLDSLSFQITFILSQ